MDKSKIENLIKKYRLDIIVIASVLLISIVVVLVTQLTKVEGAYAEVTIDGTVVGKYSLSFDGVYTLNDGTNVLTIKNGEAFMSYSQCPDHTCENTGKIKYVGQTIVCLPNRLTISIVGQTDDHVDFIS